MTAAEKTKKAKKNDIKVKSGQTFVPAEAFTQLIAVVNTYGNKKTKAAMGRIVDRVNHNEYGPIIVSTEIIVEDDKKSEK